MSVKFTLDKTEQYLTLIKAGIEQKKNRVTEIWYQKGRGKSENWQEFVTGSYWGENDTWYWFRTKITVTEEQAGQYLHCHLITGREGLWNALNPQMLVYVDGTLRFTLDTNHQTFCLSACAEAGTEYLLEFEVYSGRENGNVFFEDLPCQFKLYTYHHDADSERLYYDLYAAKCTAELYPETDYRRIQIEEYLNTAVNMLDCRSPLSAEYVESLQRASEYMRKEFYEGFCGQEEVIANCVGHTHIDVAWLWTLEQTRAKAVRSFLTELNLMEEYPEHRFSSSQPQLYQFVKEEQPEIYEKIKERAAEGRWEVEGAMWLEADCNLCSGESLIRQILHGKRFMKEEFGVDSKVLWLPDVFGYSAALPQILKKSGVETFVTSKIHWSESNHFPYDTFLWKGIDGTELFTQFITASDPDVKLGDDNTFSTYNAQILPITLAKGWEIYQQKDINNEILVSFGYGDGGGGVTREMIEMHRRMEHGIPGSPKTRITTIADALERIKDRTKGKKIPKWQGELYLELHRGTYTSMARNQKYNRLAEFLMQHAETVSLINKRLLQNEYPKKQLYDSWTTVLLNQFHDIIPGSSIKEVYEESQQQYLDLIDRNTEMAADSLQDLAREVSKKGMFVYNPIGITRSGIVEYEGHKYFVKDVPAMGWTVIEHPDEICADSIRTEDGCIENRFYRITYDETGALTGIYDKENDREVLSGRANVLEAYEDYPRAWDNWELSNYHKEKMWEINDVQELYTQEDEASVTLVIRRQFLNSAVQQKVIVYREIPRIDFDVEFDWREHHIFVKTAFPVDILSDKASYEIQYGAIERPAHTNTSWDAAKFEVCAHKWADYAEYGYGAALLNDCKYGHDIHDGVMRLSLIKCGTYPNAEADIGCHYVRYALMPHAGSWQEAGVSNEAYAFNCPLMARKAEGNGTLPGTYSFVSADCPNIFITAAKEACDSEAVIIRAYEAYGKRTKTTLSFGFDAESAEEVDLMEQNIYEEKAVRENSLTAVFGPYEIKTFRISSKN